MTQTLEGPPAGGRPLGRRVIAPLGGVGTVLARVTVPGGHREEAPAS